MGSTAIRPRAGRKAPDGGISEQTSCSAGRPKPSDGCAESERPSASLALLDDEDAGVRRAAAERFIKQQRDPRATAALLARVGDDEVFMWRTDLRQLIQNQRPIDELVAALGSDQLRVRRFAARALADIDDPLAREALTGALDDEDPGVRWFARSALGEGTRLSYPFERRMAVEMQSATQSERMTAEFGELVQTIYPTGEFTYGSFRDFVDYDRMVLSTLFHELQEAGAIESTGYETFRVRRT